MDALILDMGNDMRGECLLPGYEGKIELLSFSHGDTGRITGDISTSERTSGKPNTQSMAVAKYLDAASPRLNQACCEGKLFPKVDIVIGRNEGGKISELLRYTMSSVLISSISIGGNPGDMPVETLTLSYSQIIWNYTPQGLAAGMDRAVERTRDLAENEER